MADNFSIQDLEHDEEIIDAWPVMHQLRPALASDKEFLERVRRQEAEGYHLTAYVRGGRVLALAGWRFLESLYAGYHLYVDDLITDEAARSQGCGKALLGHLEQRAKEAGCRALHLDSGTQRKDAHRFYQRESMDLKCYHFEKKFP